jgi:glycogen debranching enzyme
MPDGAATRTAARGRMSSHPSGDSDLIGEGLRAARALLHRNLTAHGILAATPSARAEKRRYTRVFGRDAGICALAMALSGDAGLIAGARAGLATLARHQADNGQIPKFVDPEEQEPDFWYLGCIDATLWWLIAADFLATHAPDARFAREIEPGIERALDWLRAQEHPRLHLVQQNEASDWADIMPRSGFVLYSNALWYHVKRRYDLPHADETHYHFNHLFHPFSRDLPEYHRLRLLTHYVRQKARDRHLYLSFVNFSFFGEEGDVFGNLLAILFGLADDVQASRILRALEREAVSDPVPVRVTCEPIRRRDPLWRLYMARHRQNLEHQYHNGGCWPFVGGFWVMALAARGQQQQARQELDRLAAANKKSRWQFNEWFHGKTGTPRGMPGQSWNAAMLLLAHHALTAKVF